ncbi:MAG: response regulator [Anaerolineae bacterium]
MRDQTVVLVVDDDQSELGYYYRVLAWAGFKVVTAVDGLEALDLLRLGDFDMVVADIKMPYLDGYELYRQAREEGRLAKIPFLFVTAYEAGSDVRTYGERMGAGPHLTKPVAPEALIASVNRHLEKSYPSVIEGTPDNAIQSD